MENSPAPSNIVNALLLREDISSNAVGLLYYIIIIIYIYIGSWSCAALPVTIEIKPRDLPYHKVH